MSFITSTLIMDICDLGGIWTSNCSSLPSLAIELRYATTEPGPDAKSRSSNRLMTSSYRLDAYSSRISVSCLTKLPGDASAAS